jgi:SRSO17 transposase
LFTLERVAVSTGLFLDDLLGDEQGKTEWMQAETADNPDQWRQKPILSHGPWDTDVLHDLVQSYVFEHLTIEDAVVLIDEMEFLKQDNASCGIAPQYMGSVGKITNCQIGIFAA